MTTIKGFLFDLDGVITDTARLHSTAWATIAKQVGAPWTPALQAHLKGIDRTHSLALILQAAKRTDLGESDRQALADLKNQRYLQLVQDLTPADILPGIKAFLDSLQAAGFQLALASSSQNAPLVLKHLGLTDYFPKIVDPTTLTHGKPDPEIYAKAAALLNLPPQACVGVEDAAAGVAAIIAAKAVSVGIGDPQILAAAKVVVPTTAELTLPALREALGGELLG